jgi:hypothetical protein
LTIVTKGKLINKKNKLAKAIAAVILLSGVIGFKNLELKVLFIRKTTILKNKERQLVLSPSIYPYHYIPR